MVGATTCVAKSGSSQPFFDLKLAFGRCTHTPGTDVETDGQVAGSNVGNGASSSGGRLTLVRSEPDISPRPMNVCTWSGAGAANIEIDATLLTVKPQMPTSGIEQAVSKFVDPLSGLLEPVNFLRS